MSDALLAPLSALTIPDADALRARASVALESARAIVIDSQSMYEIAAEELRAVKAAAAKHEDDRKALVGPLNQVVKAINDRYRPGGEFFAEAERIVKGAMLTWQDKVEAERREQQRLADERAAAERRAMEEAAAKQRAEAAALEAAGKAEEAQAVAQAAAASETAAAVVVPTQVSAAAKVAGVSTSTTMDWEVLDKVALIKDIASKIDSNPMLANLLNVDGVTMRSMLRAARGEIALAGLRVFPKKTLRAA